MAELVFEVGVEEMPALWLPGLARQLGTGFARAAGQGHLDPAEVQTRWTPRRLVLRAEVAERQPDREEQVWGPSLKVARDAAGEWTGAAHGFARKNGIGVDALQDAPRDPGKPDAQVRAFDGEASGRKADIRRRHFQRPGRVWAKLLDQPVGCPKERGPRALQRRRAAGRRHVVRVVVVLDDERDAVERSGQ